MLQKRNARQFQIRECRIEIPDDLPRLNRHIFDCVKDGGQIHPSRGDYAVYLPHVLNKCIRYRQHHTQSIAKHEHGQYGQREGDDVNGYR